MACQICMRLTELIAIKDTQIDERDRKIDQLDRLSYDLDILRMGQEKELNELKLRHPALYSDLAALCINLARDSIKADNEIEVQNSIVAIVNFLRKNGWKE